MQMANEKNEEVIAGRTLIKVVFSWSVQDVLNDQLYKNHVKQIPETFSSTPNYLKSFVLPLVEETHADMSSGMGTLARSPCRQIHSFQKSKGFKLPRNLFYTIALKPAANEVNNGNVYEPQGGDLIAVTSVRPQNVGDLEKHYIVAYVRHVKEEGTMLSVLLSEPISSDECAHVSMKSPNLFGTYLINLTTNIRIWQALTSVPKQRNMKVLASVLQKPTDEGKCNHCRSSEDSSNSEMEFMKRIGWSGLNESQRNAVLSCVRSRKCKHEHTVKLVWGPPGTGKTNMVGFMLHFLLGTRHRTLTCAPTNVAILEVTERLVKRVASTGTPWGYGLGDIVLFGSSERMKIDDRDELQDVFLEYRIDLLTECFASRTGWRDSLLSVISLLKDPLTQFALPDPQDEAEEGSDSDAARKALIKEKEKRDCYLIYKDCLRNRFDHLVGKLEFCIETLCKHLPTLVLTPQTVETMSGVEEALTSLQKLLGGIAPEELMHVFSSGYDGKDRGVLQARDARMRCLCLLKSLSTAFHLPFYGDIIDRKVVMEYSLENACLVFCTVSGSAKLHLNGKSPWELVVIDEAAQLKECESTIPLQLPHVRHVVLVGDDLQLPAMVKSKVCGNANFGRSLFERLASLGHKKHLINVQHRMHPSISLFPSKEFYGGQILDAQNVKLRSYRKQFLQGKMFGPYSFINVRHGSEAVGNNYSKKNMVEVAVVSEILARLNEEVKTSKKKVRVGVISPYNAQVYAITERLGDSYSSDPQSDFSVSVRSVDGFQGGEADVVIISTVRSNSYGTIGFVSNNRRANVALTRARHCLWIVGNCTTLTKRRSVWKKLVENAKERQCFHEADEDKGLACAMAASLVKLKEIRASHDLTSLLFRDSKWTVRFDKAFWSSMALARNSDCFEEVMTMLVNLAHGWRIGEPPQIIEHYTVKQRCLVWAVDIESEALLHTQILKVYGFTELADARTLSKKLDKMYQSYTPEKLSRCKYRRTDEDLAVPMAWPAYEVDPLSFLSEPLASLSLKDEPKRAHRPKDGRKG